MPYDLADSPYRWLIGPADMRTVYRQHNRGIGVDTSSPDYLNVDSWMDPSSSEYNSTLARAIFHYQARAARDEQFEICIANDDMKDAAWCYGHKSQVMLDGTFGICDKKMLLFILMGVDEKKKGVPLAFLLFSAPGGNQKSVLVTTRRSFGNFFRNGRTHLALVTGNPSSRMLLSPIQI